jgi:putative transposase
VDVAAGLVAFVARLGCERAAGQGQLAAMQAELDAQCTIIRQQALELDMFRRRLGVMVPRERPHFQPRDRLTILRLMWLNGWSVKEVAKRFVLGLATVHRWLKAWHGKADVGVFFGRASWNKLSDAVRDLIHDCRLQFPEPDVGTRTIAAQIERASIALSRSTVQRVLKEPPHRKSGGVRTVNDGELPPSVKAFHILAPARANRTWHLDLTVIRILWFHFCVAALLDGYSRKLLALRLFSATPKTKDMLAVVKTAITVYGKPRFIVTDHGPQFRKRFTRVLARKPLAIAHVRGKVRSFRFNGKVERLFKTMKLWQRVAMLFLGADAIQQRLDSFRHWYNGGRCHQSLNGRTPDEAWSGVVRVEPTRFAARYRNQPAFCVRRLHHAGDPHLPLFDIQIVRAAGKAA